MSASLTSAADIVNAALRRIGYKERVEDLFEGSDASRVALDIYGHTRDELLRSGDWGFAVRDVALVIVKAAPAGGYVPGIVAWSNAYPALPWRFSYGYPADCIKVRAVKPVPLFLVDMDPQPHRFEIDNDPLLAVKVILSDVPDAVLTYTARVTDPAQWDADFAEALVSVLAKRLAPGLAKAKAAGVEVEKIEAGDEAQAKQAADNRQG